MTHRIASTTKNTLAIVLALMAITAGVFTLGAGTASAQSMPASSVSPSDAPAGSTINVDGQGFAPFEIVEINYGGTTIGVGVADQNGSFSTTATIDPTMPVGAHPMDFVGDLGSSHDVHYTVTAQPAPTSTPAPKAPAGSPAPASRAPSASNTPQNPAVVVRTPAAQQVQASASDDSTQDDDDNDQPAEVSDVNVDEVDPKASDEQASVVADDSSGNTWLPATAIAAILALGLGGGLLVSSRRRNNEECV